MVDMIGTDAVQSKNSTSFEYCNIPQLGRIRNYKSWKSPKILENLPARLVYRNRRIAYSDRPRAADGRVGRNTETKGGRPAQRIRSENMDPVLAAFDRKVAVLRGVDRDRIKSALRRDIQALKAEAERTHGRMLERF